MVEWFIRTYWYLTGRCTACGMHMIVSGNGVGVCITHGEAAWRMNAESVCD